MRAIVDCNSFYCSCERVFKPELEGKPVVVLSNNDGCVISISDEAKLLGVNMTTPYFLLQDDFEKHHVTAFSSNYNLYGDMSWRVMETLRQMIGKENVEVYSVDECFLNLDQFEKKDLNELAKNIKQTAEQWTGVAVSIGVAPTKVLSKVANRLAKKDKKESSCIMVINTAEKINEALSRTPVKDVWGVGNKFAAKLNTFGIFDAYQLSNMPQEWMRKNFGGVVGMRLLKELRGEPVLEMNEELDEKKMIATTRMFGKPVTTLDSIKEAVATYVSRGAEKLRRQQSAANVVNVFAVYKDGKAKKENEHFSHGSTASRSMVLPHATSVTNELIKPAVQLAEEIFQEGRLYKKAGVILSGLTPDTTIQGNLFVSPAQNSSRMLMSMIDNINFSQRNDVLKFASSGTKRNWKMRQEHISSRYTTRWKELKKVS